MAQLSISHKRQSSSTSYHTIEKSEMLNKSFFTSEGKMVKKIEKLFSKYEGKVDDFLKDMLKKSIINPPFTWEKIINKCDKTSSLVYIFVSKQHIVGCYHYESVKIGDKSIVDNESGFFMTKRAKIELNFYKANYESVIYNANSQMISIGKPSCFDILFEGNEVKVRTELAPSNTEWIYQFIYKL